MKTLDKIVELVSVEIPGLKLSHVEAGADVMSEIIRELEESTGIEGLTRSPRLVYKKILFTSPDGFGTRRVEGVFVKTLTHIVQEAWAR